LNVIVLSTARVEPMLAGVVKPKVTAVAVPVIGVATVTVGLSEYSWLVAAVVKVTGSAPVPAADTASDTVRLCVVVVPDDTSLADGLVIATVVLMEQAVLAARILE
jgi:hypothetical protein